MKRLIIASLSGVLFGFVCFGLASSSPGPLAWPIVLQIITSRTLIGVAIGISCLSMIHWSIHGIIMGILFSIPIAFSGLMAPDSPDYNKISILIFTIILGAIYGLLIEVITSIIFKAKINK